MDVKYIHYEDGGIFANNDNWALSTYFCFMVAQNCSKLHA